MTIARNVTLNVRILSIINCLADLLDGQTANLPDNSSEDGILLQRDCPNDDSEIIRRAKEEGVVDVPFSGYVTKEACCKFVCEILKCVLYQRQQLPMTYDQLKYHQKQQQQASTQVKYWLGKAAEYFTTTECQRFVFVSSFSL